MKRLLPIAIAVLIFASCKKDNTIDSNTYGTALQSTASSSGVIAVSVNPSVSGDSIYVVNACGRKSGKDSVAFSVLPPAVATYLSASYSGYTFTKAYKTDSSGITTGYVVIISYNSKAVGLKFDAAGTFVQVLEQREGRDMREGRGWHEGGFFGSRNGSPKDSIALSALPSPVLSYFAASYPQDTLKKAFTSKDGSIVVLSADNGVYTTVFTAAGVFVKRDTLPAHNSKVTAVAQTALPANAQSYLSSTYPGYVFKFAFAIAKAGVVQGFVVLIDANNTRYAVQFDATGSFVKAVTVH